MASEPVLNNTNVSNNSSFWQFNSDCLPYNHNVLQTKASTSQNIYPAYQTISPGSSFCTSHFNTVGTDYKSVISYQPYNSEIQESTCEDGERLKYYPCSQNYPLQGRAYCTPSSLTNNSFKPLFNPIYQNNFFDPKDYQSGYVNAYCASNESYLNQQTNEQKWPSINISDSSLSHCSVANFQNKEPEKSKNSHEEYFSESSEDSSNQSNKNESFVSNGKADQQQIKNQNSNQKKTRTKDKYRVVYTELQRSELEKEFNFSKYITSRRKSELAGKLDLSQRQNRRAKDRKMNKKKKCENSLNSQMENLTPRLAIQNNEITHSFHGLNSYDPKQFIWPGEPNQPRAFADINGQLNSRHTQANSSEFLIYNQNGLNYGI